DDGVAVLEGGLGALLLQPRRLDPVEEPVVAKDRVTELRLRVLDVGGLGLPLIFRLGRERGGPSLADPGCAQRSIRGEAALLELRLEGSQLALERQQLRRV